MTGPPRRAGGAVNRLQGAWRRLDGDQRLAAAAALALLASMLLPWYRETTTAIVDRRLQSIPNSLSALEVYSFVEAAILVVAVGVLVLLWARAEGRAFHLPGGDGGVIMAAGLWTMLLIFYRQFDRPDRNGVKVDVSVNWGIFIAFLIGALLAFAGHRIRSAHTPEPLTDLTPRGTGSDHEPEPAPDGEPTVVARRREPGSRADPAAEHDAGVYDAETERGERQLSFDEPVEQRGPTAP
jgi:hypothetical protein